MDKELIYTREELDAWIKENGGKGAQVLLPRNTYHAIGYNNCRLLTESIRLHNKYGIIIGIDGYGRGYTQQGEQTFWFIVMRIGGNQYYVLWPNMRTNNVKVIPYPHTCKLCRAPSRNCVDFVLCSNVKCKANNKVAKIIKAIETNKYGATAEQPIKPICPVCNKPATMGLLFGPKHGGRIICKKDGKQPYRFKVGKWYVGATGVLQFVGGEERWRKTKPKK